MLAVNQKLAADLFIKTVMKPTRDGYGEGLVLAGDKDKNVVVLCCDLTESTRAESFAKKYPERFVECGVAEQNMAGVAAGLALSGKVSFINSYAVFSPGRNWDQLRISVCYSKANVKIAGCHAGISIGADGATHQALEDIVLMRVLPSMTVIVPCDALEARKATLAAAEMEGPCYIRLGREKTPVITTDDSPFQIGKAQVYREGSDVTVVACGAMVYESLVAAEQLSKEGIEVEIINCSTIKPLDVSTLYKSVMKTGRAVTVEEHQIIGGLGGAVAEALSVKGGFPMRMVGMKDSFGESGKPEELLTKYGMKAQDIIKAVKSF
ncbi:MAG: transketolase family protein [bacterium]